MTLAANGRRRDPLRPHRRRARSWAVAGDRRGKSLFWAGMNKGKRSLAIDISKPEGKEIITRLICAPGPDAASSDQPAPRAAGSTTTNSASIAKT